MNIEKLCRILGIKYKIRHSGNGTEIYTVKCPYCSSGSHKHKDWSGALLESNNKLRYSCWRGCNSSIFQVLQDLSGSDIDEVKEALSLSSSEYHKELKLDETKHKFELPEDIGLTQKYRDYLSYRGFNPEEVTENYGLKFTPESPYVYCGQNLSNYIVFPVYDFNNRVVSFVARSVSPTSLFRYTFPPNSCAKDFGWGNQLIKNKSFVVITEGTMDAMKLLSVGVPAIACLGINVNYAFIKNIVKNYKFAMVIFDNEPEALKQQTKLVNALSLLIPCYTIPYMYDNDLGACSESQLNEIKNKIYKKIK